MPIRTAVSCACAGTASRAARTVVKNPSRMLARRMARLPRSIWAITAGGRAAWPLLQLVSVLGLDQIPSLAVTVEAHRVAHAAERAHDLAAILAAHRRHQLGEEFRPIGERGLN